MILEIYTFLHVLVSLIGILSGFVIIFGMLAGKRADNWTALFLAATVATSLTGFFFPVHQFMPSHAVGILSLMVLTLAIYARYPRQLAGAWRNVYVVGAVLALYLNVFVGVFQAFLKIPLLHAVAPTQTEAPFKMTQLAVLVSFVLLGIAGAVRFRYESVRVT